MKAQYEKATRLANLINIRLAAAVEEYKRDIDIQDMSVTFMPCTDLTDKPLAVPLFHVDKPSGDASFLFMSKGHKVYIVLTQTGFIYEIADKGDSDHGNAI